MKKFTHIIETIAIATIVFLCNCCSGCNSKQRATPEELEAANAMARSRAMELKPVEKPDTMLIENILIDIRERETRLRANGHDDVADELIGTFLSTLDSINPSLANELK